MKTSEDKASSPFAAGALAVGCGGGEDRFTGAPSAIFWTPETISRSPALRPDFDDVVVAHHWPGLDGTLARDGGAASPPSTT